MRVGIVTGRPVERLQWQLRQDGDSVEAFLAENGDVVPRSSNGSRGKLASSDLISWSRAYRLDVLEPAAAPSDGVRVRH